jgi:hypothetical protein
MLTRHNANDFYILYRRHLPNNDISPRFVIYRQLDYGHDFVKDFRTLREANKNFRLLTKEALQYQTELNKEAKR